VNSQHHSKLCLETYSFFYSNYVSADGTCSGATSPHKVFVSNIARFSFAVYFVFDSGLTMVVTGRVTAATGCRTIH
jgi:hypothetical protein